MTKMQSYLSVFLMTLAIGLAVLDANQNHESIVTLDRREESFVKAKNDREIGIGGRSQDERWLSQLRVEEPELATV